MAKHKGEDYNIKWQRKPCDDPIEWKEFRDEDLFLCHNCKGWWPYYKYTQGKIFEFGDDDNTYKFINDNKDRGGRKWACNYCMEKILYENNIITITNKEGKIINYKIDHPILNK